MADVIQIVAGVPAVVIEVLHLGPQGPAGTLSVTPGDVPTSPSDPVGVDGQIRADGSHLYVRVSAVWRRVALESF